MRYVRHDDWIPHISHPIIFCMIVWKKSKWV